MELIGQIVKHKIFGLGKIVEFNETYIVVKFEEEAEKDFVYPDAFDLYLSLENHELAAKIEEKLVIYRKKEAERKLKEEEMRMESLRLDMIREEKEKAKKIDIKDFDSNVVFKSIFCDGGSDGKTIGYKAICSDEMIDYNINKSKNKICSSSECNCSRYLQGSISRTELDSNSNDNLCYESRLLKNWHAVPDITFTGAPGTKTKRLKNINQGSLILLSTVMPNEKEKDRIIFGVYLLQNDYELDYKSKGYLGSHDKYKIELSLEEAKMLKFWDFYYNKNNPERIVNNSIPYRYLDDIQAAQILKAISEIKKDKADEELATELLEYYCKNKKIDINDIPELQGALQLKKAASSC